MKDIIEYNLIYKNGEEFITEDKEEADMKFEEDKEKIEQYYSKQWIQEEDFDDWTEGYVEVFYSNINKEEE